MAYTIGFMADPHIGLTTHDANVRTCLDWLQAHAANLVALGVAGNLDEGPDAVGSFSSWIWDADGGNLAAAVQLLVAMGTHDANLGPDRVNCGNIVAPPFSNATDLYPTLFIDGREYYSWDYGADLRIAVLNNISDDLDANNGESIYFNCNPPGAGDSINPDYSGITVEDSAQRLWLDAVFDASNPWKIVMGHRGFYVPSSLHALPNNVDGRDALKTPVDKGVSLIVTGNMGVGSFSGPWYPPIEPRVAGQVGAYSLSLCGGHIVNYVSSRVLPDQVHTCHWSSGGAIASGITHVAMLYCNGLLGHLTIFQCSNAVPAGAVVFETDIQVQSNAAVWPTALPVSALVDGWQGSSPMEVLEVKRDHGPDRVRLISAGGRTTSPVRFVFTKAQLFDPSPNGFLAFYRDDTLGGTIPFTWKYPGTVDVVNCQFRLPPPTWTRVGPDSWEVNCMVEYLR